MGVGESPPASASGGAGLSIDTFKEYTRTCGVRKVQREYERMAEEARQNSRTATEEMKARGHKDYAAFSKGCPEFPLTCWPTEFAELGSGFVLYFHFLSMLGFLFILLFLLQIPALAAYAGEDWLAGWQWNDWQKAYSSVNDCKKCVSTNGISFSYANASGTSVVASYGDYCAAWDMDMCTTPSSCIFSDPAKWVCQNWCFVPNYCSAAPNKAKPSMTGRHYPGNYVKSYEACPQQDSLIQQCTGFRGADKMFNEAGVVAGHHDYVGTFWLTPGNFGPNEAESVLIPTMYTVCVAVLCGIIFMTYQWMVVTNHKVDADTTSPNDFAALIRGLPSTATDGKAIAEFFRKNAVFGKEDTEVVKVVIGWDAQEYVDKIRELKDLRAQKAELADDDPQHEEIQKRVQQINSDLSSSATEKAARLRSSGVVVVVFRYQSDLRACLSRWTSSWARWFYCDATDACFLPQDNHFWKSGELPRFPIGDPPQPVHKIQVERAPNPGDINWMELGVPQEKRIKMFAKTNGVMFLLILISFGCCYGLNKIQDLLRDGGQGMTSDILAILPALGVGVANAALSFAARKLGAKEYHDTKTVEEFSQALKMSIGMILNTAGVMYIINARPKEWYQNGGLVTDAFTMLALNACMPPFVPYIDIGYRMKKMVRRQLTQEKLDHMNAVGSKKPTTPDEQMALKKVRADIQKFQNAYAPSPMNETRRYALALKTSVCCLFYMPMVPFIALVGAFGIFLQYWIDKYLLLRWYKRPAKPASAAMAMFSLKFLKYVAPIGLTITIWLFLTPSWEKKGDVYRNIIVSGVIALCFSVAMPLSIWTKTFYALFGAKLRHADTEQDYYKAQYMWSTEMKYHKDHFMLKPLPESVNPEYLKPGEESAATVEAVKASYGAAAAQVAEDAGKEDALQIKGGKVVSGRFSDAGKAPAVAEPAPTVYGAAAASPPEEPPAKEPEPAPAPEPETATEPLITAAGAAATGSSGAPVWEFEAGHGYRRFESDCHDFIEKQYQKWTAGKGKEQIEVKTGDKKLSLNFKKMTQKLVGSSNIRSVRRRTE